MRSNGFPGSMMSSPLPSPTLIPVLSAPAPAPRPRIVQVSLPTRLAEMEKLLAADGSAGVTPEGIEVRPLLVGSPMDLAAVDRYIVVLDLDRSAIASDLNFRTQLRSGGARSLGFASLLLAAYLAVSAWVTKPLLRLADLDAKALSSASDSTRDRVPANEVSRVRTRSPALSEARQSRNDPTQSRQRSSPDALPDVTLLLDESLAILATQLDDDGQSELGIEHLGDLLSGEIVDHVAATMRLLERGASDAFEFAVGSTIYRAMLEHRDDGFVLQIAEGDGDIVPDADPSVAAAAILSDLLTTLPVSVIETDSQGVIEYANRGIFGAPGPDEIIGRSIGDVLPIEYAEAGRQAMRQARKTSQPQTFVVPAAGAPDGLGWTNYVVANAVDDGISYFILSTELEAEPAVDDPEPVDTFALEEQIWSLELKVSEYEEEIAGLNAAVEEARSRVADTAVASTSLVDGISTPMTDVVRLTHAIGSGDVPKQVRGDVDALWTAVTSLAGALDGQLETSFGNALVKPETSEDERFHLATLLDEVAIEAGAKAPNVSSRISAFVQPSLPKWLFGNEHEARSAVLQMADFARLVCHDRPLIFAAMQDASTGRSIQVRFEVQIPPPRLDDDALAILRGCIRGELDEADLVDAFGGAHVNTLLPDGDSPDIELVTVNDEATVLRCSMSFELAEDLDADHSWIRGLRTLIIQETGDDGNGIQSALSAFGIIGYVVSGEKDLVDALRIAEDYANPYRLVIADVDTPQLESFVGQLFDGDAPVVLVGKKSESAMVGAISAGYNGYIAKPVRQVDLLEVILSTVEPPASSTHANAA
ncbi:MAG: PAS domain-containing protein [Thermomicrobiales bacterium]